MFLAYFVVGRRCGKEYLVLKEIMVQKAGFTPPSPKPVRKSIREPHWHSSPKTAELYHKLSHKHPPPGHYL